MKRVNVLIFSIFCLLSLSSFAEITVNNLKFSAADSKGTLLINYKGNLNDYPELKINKNSIYVIIPDAGVEKVINKKVRFSTNRADTTLHASQFTGKSARVKVIFPFDVDAQKEMVSLTLRDNKIELSFPKLKANENYLSLIRNQNKQSDQSSKKDLIKSATVAKDLLNEDYLNSLISQQKKINSHKIQPKQVSSDTLGMSNPSKDVVKTTQAAPAKSLLSNNKNSFSMVEYGGKFVAFLGVVLLLFYGVIAMMKKGFIKKGKLGFLNKTEQVTVLSQTYIAPKKSLMLIKAHNQVFLVSNTDAGIHPISEIKDVTGLLKDGELKIAGDNFDTNLGSAAVDNLIDNKVKLKEDITQSNKQSSLSDFIGVKDKVKFSDQLKKKAKSLKPLQ